jgi:hypothetical protein
MTLSHGSQANPQKCAPWGPRNPQNFWVGGIPLRYIGESWCVWAAEKPMFGHCIAHGSGLFSRHLGVRPGPQTRPVRGRLVGRGRSCCGLQLTGAGCGRPWCRFGWPGVAVAVLGCGFVPPGLAVACYGCPGEAPWLIKACFHCRTI